MSRCSLLFIYLLSTVVFADENELYKKKLGLEIDWTCAKTILSEKRYNDTLVDLDNCEYSMQVEIEKLFRNEDIDEPVSAFCGNESILYCASIVWIRLRPCLSDVQITFLDHRSISYVAEKNAVCQKNGKLLKDYMKTGLKCFGNKVNEVMKCGTKFPESEDFENYYSKKNCKIWRQRVLCLAEIAKSCESNETTYSYLIKSNEGKMEYTPCKSLFVPDDSGSASREIPAFSLIATLLLCIFNRIL